MAHHQLAHRHERKAQGWFRRCPGAGRRRTTPADQGQGPTTSARRRGLAHRRRRMSGENKYYLANLPAKTNLRTLATTIKARWVCEQAHQQMKEELGLDHFEGAAAIRRLFQLYGFELRG